MVSDRSALKEVLGMYALVSVATFAVTRLRGVEPLSEYVHLAVGAFFLFGALRMASRDRGPRPNTTHSTSDSASDAEMAAGVPAPPVVGVDRFGMSVGGLLGPAPDEGAPGPFGIFDLGRTMQRGYKSAAREMMLAMGVAAIIFPFFAIGFSFWHGPSHEFVFRLPPDFASFAAAQFLVVGLPEEAFFRGFVQTRLHDVWTSRTRIFGIELNVKAWLLQAFLFGLIHFVVDLNPARLAVFFPGLVFGLFRAWRGGIGAAIAFHALSNIYSEILVRGWLQ